MKRLTTLFIAITLISSIILTGCGKKNKPVEVAKPELTEEQAATAKNIDITLKRYEQDLFNIDQKAGDGNAATSDEAVAYYVSRYKDLRCICTNYPKWLLSKVQ